MQFKEEYLVFLMGYSPYEDVFFCDYKDEPIITWLPVCRHTILPVHNTNSRGSLSPCGS